MKDRLEFAYYVIADVDKIQDFIFESSSLKHIVGASVLIAYLTSREFCYENNILDRNDKVDNTGELTGKKWLEIYFGGGNLKLLFAGKDEAMRFLRFYQLQFYREVESASFTSIIYKINVSDAGLFKDGLETAEIELNRLKQGKQKTVNSFANPVFEICPFCKKRCLEKKEEFLIYNQDKGEKESACKDCWKKDEAQDEKKVETKFKDTLLGKFFNRYRQQGHPSRVKFMTEFDDLSDGEGSFLGIVTIDGNRFGEKIRSMIEKQVKKDTAENEVDQYVNLLNRFSKDTGEKTLLALHNTVEKSDYEDKIFFRPIIIGGDDICFVMDGWQVLPFTENLLKELEKQFAGYHLTFAAGISIVKPHFPFFVAHGLSESLMKNVKGISRNYSGLDFEVIFSSSVETLDQMREKKYKYTMNGQNYMTTFRPYYIDAENKKGTNEETLAYRFLSPTLGMALGVENRSLLARNKIKRLRALVRKGKIESAYEFRLMISRMTGAERKNIWNRLAKIYRSGEHKQIWVKNGDTLYNNFIDISELNEFYKGKSRGESHAD